MTPFAHSARGGRVPQTYRDHVAGVVDVACRNVHSLLPFAAHQNAESYLDIVRTSAIYHDLGKLNPHNQDVLSGRKEAAHLPVEHRDAGVSHLIGNHPENPSATLVYAHHRPGLPNLMDQRTAPFPFRFDDSAREDSDAHLNEYLELHHRAVGRAFKTDSTVPAKRLSALEHRRVQLRTQLLIGESPIGRTDYTPVA